MDFPGINVDSVTWTKRFLFRFLALLCWIRDSKASAQDEVRSETTMRMRRVVCVSKKMSVRAQGHPVTRNSRTICPGENILETPRSHFALRFLGRHMNDLFHGSHHVSQ
jgi:hypothetical protein